MKQLLYNAPIEMNWSSIIDLFYFNPFSFHSLSLLQKAETERQTKFQFHPEQRLVLKQREYKQDLDIARQAKEQ